ncbi:ADP-ribosyltransferase family protein [Methanocalculus sp. MC3]
MKVPSLIILLLLLVSAAGCAASAPSVDLPATPAGSYPVPPEYIPEATIILEQPAALVSSPYTDRGFSAATTASISWWLSPDFYENTNLYRRYLRSTEAEQLAYPGEQQIFFGFITEHLDLAITESDTDEEIILFRGISPGFAETVLSNAAYDEAAFASTSYDLTIPLITYGSSGDDGYSNILLLSRSTGDHLLYIHEGEREILLPRDLTWQVVMVTEIGDLSIESDFPLFSNGEMHESVQHVRLITIVERES